MAEKYGTIPKDFKGRLAYFWDYYKWHTLAVLFAAAVIGVSVAQCASRVDPDYTVILAVSKTVLPEYAEQIGTYLERYGEDVNGDGQVSVQIVDVSVGNSAADTQLAMAQKTKLQAEIAVGNAMIFVADEEQFKYLDEQINLFQTPGFFRDKEGKAFNWKNTKFEKEINADRYFPENLYVSLRTVKGSAAEKTNENSRKLEAAAKKLLEKFVADNPPLDESE